LKKILYENSSVAFNDLERLDILNGQTMSEKWQRCLNLSVCKSYNFHFTLTKNDYSACFLTSSDASIHYQKVYSYLGQIEQAITVRNRLAHGQWKTQLNNRCTQLAGNDVHSFFLLNDNIQKLDLLYDTYKLIAEIISSYVVYKDKVLTDNFNKHIAQQIKKIEDNQMRIRKSKFNNYCKPFFKKECKERECKKIYMAQFRSE